MTRKKEDYHRPIKVIKYRYPSERINSLLEWVDADLKVDNTDPRYKAPKKFMQLIGIYLSDLTDLEKIYQMQKTYPDMDDFASQLPLLRLYQENHTIASLLAVAEEALAFYRKAKEDGLPSLSIELVELDNNGYFQDFDYACSCVRDYINFNDSPFISDFLAASGLTHYKFVRLVDIVATLDVDLYGEYLMKAGMDGTLRIEKTLDRIENIKQGVTTGYTKDGTEFDNVEFYKNIPFYDRISQDEIFDDFGYKKLAVLDNNLMRLFEQFTKPDEFKAVMKYIYEGKLGPSKCSEYPESFIRKTRFVIYGRELTDEDKDAIIKYMKDNKIPFISGAFNAVRNKHLAGKLEQSTETVAKKELTGGVIQNGQ